MRLSKAERHKRRTSQKRREKRQEKIIYRVFWGCIISFLLFQYFKPLTIGNDVKYNVFVVLLPIVAGLTIFYNYKNQILDAKAVASVKNNWHKLGYAAVFTVVISLLSFLSIGLIASIIFETLNYNVALENKTKEVIVPINRFYEGNKGKRKIYFTFNNNSEYFNISRENMKVYKAQSHIKKRLRLTLREGVWNHYLVEDWEVIR